MAGLIDSDFHQVAVLHFPAYAAGGELAFKDLDGRSEVHDSCSAMHGQLNLGAGMLYLAATTDIRSTPQLFPFGRMESSPLSLIRSCPWSCCDRAIGYTIHGCNPH